jgi:hypothetical protein
MRIKTFSYLTLLLFLGGSIYAQNAKKKEDITAIKSMCGCYEVQFNFAETFQYPKDSLSYTKSKTKHEKGLEWIELIEDQPNKLSLQHLLITGSSEDAIVKHWRQDWLYENNSILNYSKENSWKFEKLNAQKTKGQWTQKVFQVDDSPRYEGSATWVHYDGRHYWENTTDAPLPRREHTKRNDYNVLKRTNVHEITARGWIHDQDNIKIIRNEKGEDYVLAEEKGRDLYTKVAESKCKTAQEWWNKNKILWDKIRNEWEVVLSKNKDIKIKNTIDGFTLFDAFKNLNNDSTKEEIKKIISSYLIN